MNKVVWISVLNKEKNEENAKKLYQSVSRYGLGVAGHFWQDDLFNMAWAGPREDLVKKETGLWMILGSAEDLGGEDVRYGLSMLALGVQAQKGHGFPILIALTEGELDPDTLPTPLKSADVLPAGSPSLGAKLAAKANIPVKKIETGYELDVYGVQGIGQWFEVSPPKGHTWPGVMFGLSNGEINAHGVGPSHKLPERSVLNYPMKGLKLQLGDTEYMAWAVKNELTDNDSYFLRVKDYPSSILFGPMTEEEDADVFIVKLK